MKLSKAIAQSLEYHSLRKSQITHIFLHELLHFRRKDIMINWLTQVLVIIHWFNPLIWYAFYRMREDQEIACDALAMDRIDTQQSIQRLCLYAHQTGRDIL